MQITPQFVVDFETNLQALIVDEWARALQNTYWDRFMKLRPSSSKKELLEWMLTTAQIVTEGFGGNKRFDDIVAISHEIVNQNAGAGLTLTRNEINDNQLDRAGQWARHIGSSGAYWPQEKMFELILAGETAGNVSYDNVVFFSNAHPTNQLVTGGATYANLFTGAAGSTPATDPNDAIYPGAAPIDSSVTLDVAALNLTKVVAYIKSIRMPNGKPRNLRPTGILVSPANERRAMELTGAQYFGQGGTSLTASAENVLMKYGFQPPQVASELATEPNNWYIGVEDMASDEVGGLIYQEREPFVLTSYQGENESALARRKELEWHFDGRNVAAYGHPYLFFKVKAT